MCVCVREREREGGRGRERDTMFNQSTSQAKCLHPPFSLPQSKNASHRERVQKASKEGLSLPGVSGSPTLPEDFVEEALLISDILDLNEMSAVELLLAGEQQMSR